MSAENSIARGGREPDAQPEVNGFQMPPDLAARYDVRVVDGANGEQRIGLFRPNDRAPSIEITNDRVIARREDPETVAALVKIARASGWDRIVVDGSPEFRQAVCEAATREGLAVSGYEPGFNEQARVEQARREATERRERETREQAPPAGRVEPGQATADRGAAPSVDRAEQDQTLDGDGQGLSDGDRRLLLTLSRHTEDRRGLEQNMRPDMDAFGREVQFERLATNREALNASLERALKSPTLVKAFERAGYESDALRQYGKDGQWDGEVADAIYLVRSGLHRETLECEAEAAPIIADEVSTDREDRASAEQAGAERDRPPERHAVREELERQAATERRRESEELAELFLHGATDRVSSDPRLAQARQAQAAMEQHIGEVFNGDANRMATATLESRQMISDALRRGLDVSVREPTPVRQIEPVHTRPDMER